MLNRKANKSANGASKHSASRSRNAAAPKQRRHLRLFIISSKAAGHHAAHPTPPAPTEKRNGTTKNGSPKIATASQAKAAYAGRHGPGAAPATQAGQVDLTE